MSQQVINVGTVANDGTGDPLRTAFIKVNANFAEIYGVLPTDGSGNLVPISTLLTGYATLDSPHFTGDPTAPTPTPGDNDTSLATTAFVTAAIAASISGGGGGGGGTSGSSVPGRTQASGRLTLLANNPVMVSSVAAATSLIYTPYTGNTVPIYDGTSLSATIFTELTTPLNDVTKNPSPLAAGKLNDWFVWKDGSTMRLGHGPDWTSNTVRSAGTQLTMVGGILLNAQSITNGPAASRGTYVGTTYCQTSNQLLWEVAGVDIPGRYHVWNAYNRVNVGGTNVEGAGSWTSVAIVWELMNSTAANRFEAVLGLQEDSVDVMLLLMATTGAGIAYSAIAQDWTSGDPVMPTVYQASGANQDTAMTSHHSTMPAAGFHTWHALQSTSGVLATFWGLLADSWASGLTFNARM
jgi:hypothetical protein